jgi:hypothetical protein
VSAALGALMVPVGLARATSKVLRVVLDEPLAWLPMAALRVGDRRLAASRPIVRSARVADGGCAAKPRNPRPVVTLDTADDDTRQSPGARAEPTRDALLRAAQDELLHLVVQIDSDALGDIVAVRDGGVRALEIAGRGAAPAQVVIAAPSAPRDGSAAIAMALIAAGAEQVIATVRPVPRTATDQLVEQLLRSDTSDLPAALARLQGAEDLNSDDWLAFAAFGRATCESKTLR